MVYLYLFYFISCPNNGMNNNNNNNTETEGKKNAEIGKNVSVSVTPGDETTNLPCLKQIFLAADNDTALYKDEETTKAIRGMTSQTKRHVRQCDTQEKKFFAALEATPSLRKLAEWRQDEIGRKHRVFYLLISGPKDSYKYDVLNMCLVAYGTSLEKANVKRQTLAKARNENHKKAMKTLQPSTLSTYFKQLFSRFAQNGILFTKSDYKNAGAGSFHAVMKDIMGNACNYIDDYGRCPKRSDYDPKEDYKIRNCANPPWDLTDYNDLLDITVWQILTYFMLRGSREVRFFLLFVCGFFFTSTYSLFFQPTSLRLNDFIVKQMSTGKNMLCLKGFNGEKTTKVDLFKTTLREELYYHSCLEDPEDKFCVYNLFQRYIKHLPDNWQGKLLLKGLNDDDRVVAKKNGFKRFADTGINGPLGLNACNKICQRVARRCGLKNPDKQLASGRRRAGITKIANAGLPTAEVTIAARHQSWVTNVLYQIESEEIHEKRHEAQRYKVSFLCVCLNVKYIFLN